MAIAHRYECSIDGMEYLQLQSSVTIRSMKHDKDFKILNFLIKMLEND